MGKRRLTWFVLADGGRARFLKKSATNSGYEVVAEYESPEAHLPSRELGTDRPGRVQESATSAHHAIAPHHDMHQARKASFVRDVAAHLNVANSRSAFDALVLYAAPQALAELRATLDASTRSKVKAEVAKDLTTMPTAELSRYLMHLTPFK